MRTVSVCVILWKTRLDFLLKLWQLKIKYFIGCDPVLRTVEYLGGWRALGHGYFWLKFLFFCIVTCYATMLQLGEQSLALLCEILDMALVHRNMHTVKYGLHYCVYDPWFLSGGYGRLPRHSGNQCQRLASLPVSDHLTQTA